eukprot:g22939.t1
MPICCWSPEQKDWDLMQWRAVARWRAKRARGTWAAMEELYRSGKARAIGVSNYTIEHLEQLLSSSNISPMVMQGESHPHWSNKSVRDWCRKHEILFQGYAPFGGPKTELSGNHRAVNDEFVQQVADRNHLTSIHAYQPPAAEGRDIDAVLTAQLRSVNTQLTSTTDSIVPMQFVMALRQRFPRFAEMQNGAYMQQDRPGKGRPSGLDADECLRGLLTSLATTLPGSSESSNRVDELFGYRLHPGIRADLFGRGASESEELTRVLMCHLGTQTEPVSHITQGVQLSLKEHIEKSLSCRDYAFQQRSDVNSPVLGRNAQYEKTSTLESLPPYLIVQFARFGYKGANEWAGTSAAKVKLTRGSVGSVWPVVDEVMEKRPKYTDVMTSLCVRSMAGDTILEMQIGSWHVLSLPMKYFIWLRMRDGEYDLLFENHILGLDEKLGKLISEIPEHGIELMLVRNLRPDEDHPMDHWPNDEYEDHEIDQVMRRVQLLRGGATGAPRSPRSMRHAWRNTPQLTQVANAD